MDLGGATTATSSQAPTRARFPIVGVGASAGGLAASVALLRHLGAQPGIAVVIVHHLDPTRECSLVEIFSHATPLPIHAASDGLPVAANNIYVIPPNADLLVAEARRDFGGSPSPESSES